MAARADRILRFLHRSSPLNDSESSDFPLRISGEFCRHLFRGFLRHRDILHQLARAQLSFDHSHWI